tara:strand:- start:137 stop:1174 length:1038 start_codon:yes stop_codon:yes gene_type:complete
MNEMYHVIMAGGIGSRFWPMSRKNKPKQFLNLFENDNLLNLTYKRLMQVTTPERIIIITSFKYKEKIKNQFKDIPVGNIIYEPSPKNTAPAIYLSAKYIYSLDNNASVAIYPADHFIENNSQFCKIINNISKFINNNSNSIITIGIEPNYPSTSYGYINCEDNKEEVFLKINQFLEKPNSHKAKELIKEKNNLWNSGMFFSKAKTLIDEIDCFIPEIKVLFDSLDTINAYENIWDRMPKISIDYGVMEKTNKAFCIKGTFNWSDLGTWVALYDLLEKDDNGNVHKGNVIDFDSSNNLIISNNKLTSVVGLSNIAIINLDDATLVIDLFRSEEVRKIIDQLDEKYK